MGQEESQRAGRVHGEEEEMHDAKSKMKIRSRRMRREEDEIDEGRLGLSGGGRQWLAGSGWGVGREGEGKGKGKKKKKRTPKTGSRSRAEPARPFSDYRAPSEANLAGCYVAEQVVQ